MEIIVAPPVPPTPPQIRLFAGSDDSTVGDDITFLGIQDAHASPRSYRLQDHGKRNLSKNQNM